MRRARRIAGLVMCGAIGAVAVPGVAALAQDGTCDRAALLVEARMLTDAVALYDEAEEAGIDCNEVPLAVDIDIDIEQIRTLQREAQAKVSAGARAEARKDTAAALARYREALTLDRQRADAAEAIQRLTGVATTTTTTTDPFAGPNSLLELNRKDAARDAALKVVEEDGSLPPANTDLRDLITEKKPGFFARNLRSIGDWFGTWWQWVLLASAAVVAIGSRINASPTVRKIPKRPSRVPPWMSRRLKRFHRLGAWGSRLLQRVSHRLRPRVVVVVKDETGRTPSLAGGFATCLHEGLARQERITRGDPSRLLSPDAEIDLPDFSDGPPEAKWIAALWTWLNKQRRLTLKVTLLPPTAKGVSCHVVLLESHGGVVRGTEQFEQVLERPSGDDWTYPPDGDDPAPHRWLDLIPAATAWSLFTLRTISATTDQAAAELGTGEGLAYGDFLSGVAMIDRPATAAAFFQAAIDRDPNFHEARLNLAYCQAKTHRYQQAERTLDTLLAKLPPTSSAPSGTVGDRLRSIRARATYSRVVVQMNRLTPDLTDDHGQASDLRRRAGALVANVEEAAEALSDLDPSNEGLVDLKDRIQRHLRLLWTSARDLEIKYAAFFRNGSHLPGIPLPLGSPPSEDHLDQAEVIEQLEAAVAELDALSQSKRARAAYALACFWARDARLRGSNSGEATEVAATHLKDAIEHQSDLKAIWPRDPDFEPLRSELEGREVPAG